MSWVKKYCNYCQKQLPLLMFDEGNRPYQCNDCRDKEKKDEGKSNSK